MGGERGGGWLPWLYYIHLHRSSAAPTRNAHGGGSQAMICRVRLSQRWQVRTLTQPAFKTPQQDLLLLHLLLVRIRCSTRCYFIRYFFLSSLLVATCTLRTSTCFSKRVLVAERRLAASLGRCLNVLAALDWPQRRRRMNVSLCVEIFAGSLQQSSLAGPTDFCCSRLSGAVTPA